MHKLKRAWSRIGASRPRAIGVVVLVFICAGALFMVLTKASSPNDNLGLEPENGAKIGVNTCTGPGASNGGCIQFTAYTTLATALTVVGTDDVASAAICINNSANVSSVSARVTACIQVKPDDTSRARFGTYDDINKVFYPVGPWQVMSDPVSADHVSAFQCSSGKDALGLGPLGGSYYGEVMTGSNVAFGTITADSNHDCNASGGGVLSTAQWATPAIYCGQASQAPGKIVTTLDGYKTAVTGSQSEVCIAPGNYTYPTGATVISVNGGKRVIGQSPLRRPVFDSSGIPKHSQDGKQSYRTSSFTAGGKNILLANLVAQGAQTDINGVRLGLCPNCGNGIDGGEGMHLYNVKATHNNEDGIHIFTRHTGPIIPYTIENSELSSNGQFEGYSDATWAAGGMKTGNGGLIKNNVIINNGGHGLWCDGNGKSVSVCHGSAWKVMNNYVAGNSVDGITYEIVFNNPTTDQGVAPVDPPWADIENNVVNCNNTRGAIRHDNFGYAGIAAFAANVLIANNILDNRTDSHRFTHTCHNKVQGITVYNDVGSDRVPPYSHDITVRDNILNGDDVLCVSGTNITCQ